ncbi:MAG: PIN domain-containing protein [Planctomycetota bacterium]|jgi:predicted nucleic acid-binding protein
MLLDTDFMIWLLKGNRKAVKIFNDTAERQLSVVGMMELIKGCRNKKELSQLRHFIVEMDVELISISENISHRALIYMEEFALPHSLDLADALIGATATELCLDLCTANNKHYKVIPELSLKVFRP